MPEDTRGSWWTWLALVPVLGSCIGTPPPPPGSDGTGSTSTPSTTSGPSTLGPTTMTTVVNTSMPEGSETADATADASTSTSGVLDTGESSSTGPASTTSTSGSMTGASNSSSDSGTMNDCTPVLVEALTALSGADGSREWIVLHNPCPADYDLTGLSLAWGNNSGYYSAVDLTGSLAAGDCFVIGGPTSDGSNFAPVYDQILGFPGGLDGNEGAIGLFELPAMDVDVTDVPVDVVIYGPGNTAGFLDPTGAMPPPMVGDPPDNQSLQRTSLNATWQLGNPPTPNDCPGF